MIVAFLPIIWRSIVIAFYVGGCSPNLESNQDLSTITDDDLIVLFGKEIEKLDEDLTPRTANLERIEREVGKRKIVTVEEVNKIWYAGQYAMYGGGYIGMRSTLLLSFRHAWPVEMREGRVKPSDSSITAQRWTWPDYNPGSTTVPVDYACVKEKRVIGIHYHSCYVGVCDNKVDKGVGC